MSKNKAQINVDEYLEQEYGYSRQACSSLFYETLVLDRLGLLDEDKVLVRKANKLVREQLIKALIDHQMHRAESLAFQGKTAEVLTLLRNHFEEGVRGYAGMSNRELVSEVENNQVSVSLQSLELTLVSEDYLEDDGLEYALAM